MFFNVGKLQRQGNKIFAIYRKTPWKTNTGVLIKNTKFPITNTLYHVTAQQQGQETPISTEYPQKPYNWLPTKSYKKKY